MRIHAEISGYFDWAPCPPGTQITSDDAAGLRVKQMTDGTWHMRVDCATETTHDVGVHEEAICRRLVALEKLGRPSSRDAVVAEILRESFRHHLDTKHLVKINVIDDGADLVAFDALLAESEIVGPAAVAARDRYADDGDIEQYLNVTFKTQSTRKAK